MYVRNRQTLLIYLLYAFSPWILSYPFELDSERPAF